MHKLNEMKLKPSLKAFNAIQPRNGPGLLYNSRGLHRAKASTCCAYLVQRRCYGLTRVVVDVCWRPLPWKRCCCCCCSLPWCRCRQVTEASTVLSDFVVVYSPDYNCLSWPTTNASVHTHTWITQVSMDL